MGLTHKYEIGQCVIVTNSEQLCVVQEVLFHGVYPAYKVSGWESIVFETNLKPYAKLEEGGYIKDGDEIKCE